MRDPARIERILNEIGMIWSNCPDLRLGQLIMNVSDDPYYIEDEKLVKMLKEFYLR